MTINIEDDVREFYMLSTMLEDVTLENVTIIQSQSDFNFRIKEDGKSWVIKPNESIIFEDKTSVTIEKRLGDVVVGAV